MKRLRLFEAFAYTILISFVMVQTAHAGVPPFIESLTEPNEGLTVASVSQHTGFATFASSSAHGILLAVPPGASAEERAAAFMRTYGRAFGIESSSELQPMRAAAIDELGVEHVRLQQMYRGVPIRGAELLVHMKGARVLAANGHAIRNLPMDVTPATTGDRAHVLAQRFLVKHHHPEASSATYSEPRLEIIDRTLISGIGNDRPHLAWFIEVTDIGLRQFIWVDARSGGILLNFSQLTEAEYRTVYNASHISGALPGTLVRTEGGAATGDTDEDNAYTYAGATYDYYKNYHGRDSYDGLGGELRSSAHYCKDPNCPTFQNAFWNGSQMVYGDGFASADDVVAHELTHAVTEKTANLFYYMQSGALNESFSDIFGETVDQLDGLGNDAAGWRWYIGEDMSIGAIRNMMNPNLYNNPAKMSDSTYFVCSSIGWTDSGADQGGVHTNSGVPNHAYALMVDGGSYNGRTISGIGLTKAAAIEYRALTTYLTSGSGFLDDYNAINQSCADLIGTAGITSPTCTQVRYALDAVELGQPWGCAGSTVPPALCTSGVPHITRIDEFEIGMGNWTAQNTAAGSWSYVTDLAAAGTYSLWGTDPDGQSDHVAVMTNPIAVPSYGRLYFDHAYEFENDPLSGALFDGGVVEYSNNGGTTWNDARTLMDGGAVYDGTLQNTNPLGARQAFTGASYGYTGTRLNLASLAGYAVRFRFRIGSDAAVGSLGWLIDNVIFYTCSAATPFTDDPVVAQSTRIKVVHINELRARIDASRTARGLAPYSWTDAQLTAGMALKAAHLTELRAALADSFTVSGRATPAYTDPGLTHGTMAKAAHINELRSAVLAIETPP